MGGGLAIGFGPLEGFVDSLLQKFENCRAGLSDEVIQAGGAEQFFLELAEAELPQLREAIRREEGHLDEEARQELFRRVEELIGTVVVPAYARLASRFTERERNDFYLVRDPLHGLERIGWGLAGVLVGTFVVWAPFIPLWSKEWVLPFMVAGLFFPNLRRLFTIRKYERTINDLVARADREIGRIDLLYLMRGEQVPAAPSGEKPRLAPASKQETRR
jgi:hypothetical protein